MQILIKKVDTDKRIELTQKPDYLTEDRWEKAQRLKSVADYNRCLASGYLQAKMCQKLGIDNPKYEYSHKGKPSLAGRDRVAFSLSHSGEYVVLAYHESTEPVGIDIQQLRPMRAGMERRILHEKEEIVADKRTEFLNRIWALKESYVKMTGDGLSLDFRHIHIDFGNKIITAPNREQAHFIVYETMPDYIMAVSTTIAFDMYVEEL